jgi:hypothetical protein
MLNKTLVTEKDNLINQYDEPYKAEEEDDDLITV